MARLNIGESNDIDPPGLLCLGWHKAYEILITHIDKVKLIPKSHNTTQPSYYNYCHEIKGVPNLISTFMKNYLIPIFILLMFISCKEDEELTPEYDFVPTEVLLMTDGTVNIREVFEFINLFDHEVEVESVTNEVYLSDLPSDSLNYVLDYLNAKSYTNDKVWSVTGYRHYATDVITIFPKFFDIKNQENQADWLESMQILKLREKGEGFIILFHVPEGQEKEWEKRFEAYDFVKWVELNYKVPITR